MIWPFLGAAVGGQCAFWLGVWMAGRSWARRLERERAHYARMADFHFTRGQIAQTFQTLKAMTESRAKGGDAA